MFIQNFPSGPFSTNAYLVACSTTLEAAIIDPAPDSFSQIDSLIVEKKLIPRYIWLTHSHWDHIADVKKIRNKYEIPVYVHSLDAPNLEIPGSDGLPCWIKIETVTPDFFLQEGMKLELGELVFQVLETPGHSPGSVCFYEPKEAVLLSGDTLFQGSIGNLAFPTSQPERMWESLRRLSILPVQTKVFPGHGPSTTIGVELDMLKHAKEIFN